MSRYHTAYINLGLGQRITAKDWKAMDSMRSLFSFAIPTEECFTAIAEHSPILEVGAGNGYWAYELRERGVDIIPTDIVDKHHNYFPQVKGGHLWLSPEIICAEDAIEKYLDHTLMMIWPDYDKPWAFYALKKYTGQYFIFVGEGWGGCTANDAFSHLLESQWEVLKTIHIPQHMGIHDYFRIYKRQV